MNNYLVDQATVSKALSTLWQKSETVAQCGQGLTVFCLSQFFSQFFSALMLLISATGRASGLQQFLVIFSYVNVLVNISV